MRLRKDVFIALLACSCLACSIAGACERDPRMAMLERESLTLEYPILRFDVIEIPASGRVEEIEGVVELLVRSSRWIVVRSGTRLGDGARLRICPEAKLVVRFSPTDRIEFGSARDERWVQFRETTVKSEDTERPVAAGGEG